MVTEVLHTQRDFKDILLRLLKEKWSTDSVKNVDNNAPRQPTEPIREEPPLSPTISIGVPVAAADGLVDLQPS